MSVEPLDLLVSNMGANPSLYRVLEVLSDEHKTLFVISRSLKSPVTARDWDIREMHGGALEFFEVISDEMKQHSPYDLHAIRDYDFSHGCYPIQLLESADKLFLDNSFVLNRHQWSRRSTVDISHLANRLLLSR